MSGRLTILPKKTYCPWNPENVERVLRDERLERERLEREAKRSEEGRRERGRERGGDREGDGVGVDDGEDGRTDDGESERAADGGHVNLFPEAREAELRAASMGGKRGGNDAGEKKEAGIMPVPLGGEEASRRRAGAAPFYLRSRRDGGEGAKYGDASSSRTFRLGDGNNRGRAAADEITARITQGQFERREDGRKDAMDPMARFFTPSSGDRNPEKRVRASGGGAPPRGGRGARSRDPSPERVGTKDDPPPQGRREGKSGPGDGRGKKRKGGRSRRSQRAGCDSSSDDDGILPSPSSGSSSGSEAGERRRMHRRRKDDRHGRRKSRKRHRKELRRHRRRHRRDGSPPAKGPHESEPGKRKEDMEELRRRRREREARESERERLLMGMPAASALPLSSHYQDQFNPALSRN